MSILLLNGPPFSPLFWKKVQGRLSEHGISSSSINWLEYSGSFEQLETFLQTRIEQTDINTVVAHGLAVPLALQLCSKTAGIHFILCNGPLDTHKITSLLRTVPSLFFHPRVSLPFLASSVAFRRLVINPYVMNRDMIATLSKEILDNSTTRKNIYKYFKELQVWKQPKNLTGQEVSLIWGDSDFLFPAPKENLFLKNSPPILIPGGAHFHPIERPWALADQIQKLTMTKMS